MIFLRNRTNTKRQFILPWSMWRSSLVNTGYTTYCVNVIYFCLILILLTAGSISADSDHPDSSASRLRHGNSSASAVKGSTGQNANSKGQVMSVLSAQCRARCLHEFKTSNSSRTRSWRNSIRSKKGTKYLENCELDGVCSACVRPCIHSPLHLVTCSLHCYNEERVCFESCSFLKLAHTVRPGFCPAPHRASGFASACVETCREDGDCEESLKCCSNGPGCGFTCQKAVSVNKDLPRIPIIHQVAEKRKRHSVFITWKDVPIITHTNRSRSERLDVIYVLEGRKTLRERPEWGADTPWYSIIQTTRPNFLVRGIQAGYWFQFRVAAVTMQGMRGYSKPSASFKSSREIQPPRVPEQFAEDGFTIHDGKVDVVLVWQRSRSDLPIIRYMVYYSKRLKTISPVYVSLHVKKKRVNADKTTCVLEKLEPDYTYFVQVEAIARYGDLRMKSKRASMYITTYAIPHTSKSVSTTQFPIPALNDDARNLSKMISIHNLTVLQPFYYNGLVKVEASWNVSEDLQTEVEKYMIRWTPAAQCIDSSYRSDRRSRTMAATTHDQRFELYDLMFKCHYVMKVQAVNSVGRPGPVRMVSFSTPSCDSMDVLGETKPECPATGPPPKVRNLNYNLYITGPNITAVIKWRPPQTDIPITGYSIRWGEMSLSGKYARGQPSKRKYQSKPGRLKAKTLSRRVHRIELHQLNEDAKYRVFVHGVSAAGEGLMSKLDFSTPVVSTTAAPPDINIFMQKGSRRQEQAFESRGHLHGYRSAPPTTMPTAKQRSKGSAKGNSQSLFSHNVHLLTLILSFTVTYLF